jgi:hypothetical protein
MFIELITAFMQCDALKYDTGWQSLNDFSNAKPEQQTSVPSSARKASRQTRHAVARYSSELEFALQRKRSQCTPTKFPVSLPAHGSLFLASFKQPPATRSSVIGRPDRHSA